MQNKIIVISPYKVELLKTLAVVVLSKIADIIIIGRKSRIVETCFSHKINYYLFEIIDSDYEMDICFKANEIIKNKNIKVIIFGDFPQSFKKNIAYCEYEISVIDIPNLRHLLFVSASLKSEYIDYEEKKEAILVAKEFMKLLEIYYCAVGLVNYNFNNIAYIERGVIKMSLELKSNILEVIKTKDIFSDRYNLIVFDSIEATRTFIDTIVFCCKAKYANIKKAEEKYVIDAYNLTSRDILFSIFLLNKFCFNTKAS